MATSFWVVKKCVDCKRQFTSMRSVRRKRCADCQDKHFFTLRKDDTHPLEFPFKG